MKLLHSILCGLLLLYGCGSGKKLDDNLKKTIDNDLKKENLKGDVIFIKTDDGEDHKAICYDDNGMMIRKIEQYPTSVIDNVYQYQNGKLIKSICNQFAKKGNGENISNYMYDKSGSLISEVSDDYTKSFSYNNDGLVTTEITLYSPNPAFIKKIEANNYYTKKSLDSTITTSTIVNSSVFIEKHYFNKGLLISNSTIVDGEFIFSRSFNYDGNGELISFVQKSNEKGKMNIEENSCEYSYNFPNVNWTEKKTMKEGSVVSTTKRTIIYKGGDYSSYLNRFESQIAKFSNGHGSKNHSNNPNYGNNNSANDQQNYGNQQSSQQSQRKCSYCNGTGRCSTCSRTFRVHYWGGRGAGWRDKNEMRPGQIMCDTCYGTGLIYGVTPINGDPPTKPCHVCDGSGWKNCPDCNYGGNGRNIGQCSHCNGTGISR